MSEFVVLVVRADGQAHRQLVRGLEDLQGIVGGWIEAIPTRRPDVIAYGNEEGRLAGLPLNERASNFCERPVVGDVALVGYDGSPHERDAPEGLELEV